MWAGLSPTPGAPIGHITNGIHLGTWLAPELDELLRSAGVRPEAPPSVGGWEAAQSLDLDELRDVRGDAAATARGRDRASTRRC